MAKRRDRRGEIIQKAASVFLKHGYDATSMNQLAEYAQVSKPGLYYHFESKQDLLFAILSSAMDILERETRAATLASTDSEERLRRIIHSHAEMITLEDEGSFTLLVIDETGALGPEERALLTRRQRAYFETVRGTLEELRKEGRLRRIDTTVAAFSLLGMVMWISKWFRADRALGAEQVADQVTELALSAVLKDEGRSTHAVPG